MKKNVLIFCHSYTEGFIECVNQYTKLFNPDHYHVTVAYLSGKFDEETKARHMTSEVIFLNASKQEKRGLKIQSIKTLLKLHHEKNFQIVICHRFKPSYIMLWVAFFKPIPIILAVMHEMKTLRSFSRRIAIRALAKTNFYLVGVSNAVREDIAQHAKKIGTDRILTLYNAIDVEHLQPQLLSRAAARKQLNLHEKDFAFGILARLSPAKDHATLINAFASIKKNCPRAKLIIIGDGLLKPDLARQIEQLNLTTDIQLMGFLPEAFTLLPALDIFILSSAKEAFGRVLLEAMLAKVPIIASKINGIPEVVGRTGMLFEAGNSTELADKMATTYHLAETELAIWREQSFQHMINTFSLARFKETFWNLPFLK